MKTAMQQFIERAGNKIDSLNCDLVREIQQMVTEEKLSLIHAYETGLSTAIENLDIEGSEYYKKVYTDLDENTNAAPDMQVSVNSGSNKKRKRKKAA